ncbi:MAG: aminoglycoside phosphotransferase family protein [Oceanicaulis sp.]
MDSSPTERGGRRADFIKAAGWGEARVEPFPGDASTRRYFRLFRPDGATALIMDAPGGSEPPACPPGAAPVERGALGYNALARLAGNNTAAFAAIAQGLSARGFSAPKILEADVAAGFLLIEDLGDDLFARVIPERAHEGALYAHAVETVAAIQRASIEREPQAFGHGWRIQDYDRTALLTEADLFLDWYADKRCGAEITPAVRADWRSAWDAILPALDAHAPGLVLRDYHAENLIWLPEREAEARVGLLDFQDALFGHPAYDLVSLLEDARRDVPGDLHKPLADRFFDKAMLSDREAFDAAYDVLAAQRNAKILGIFVRLVRRDNKPRYEQFMPRVARNFVKDIANPALKPLHAIVREIVPGVFEEAER